MHVNAYTGHASPANLKSPSAGSGRAESAVAGVLTGRIRTKIRLNDALLAQAKAAAAKSGRTLSGVIEDALRDRCRGKTPRRSAVRFGFRPSGKGWLRPGVNLDNSAELLERHGWRRRNGVRPGLRTSGHMFSIGPAVLAANP